MRPLLLAVALVAVASAAPFVIPPLDQPILHPSVRIPPSVEASAIAFTEFSLVAASQPGCAGDISHAQVADLPEGESQDVEGIINFSDINVNGEQCGTGDPDELLKLYSQDVLDATLPGGKILNLTFEAARAVTVGGADLAVRRCGSWIEEYEQSYAFSMDIMRLLPSLSASGFIDNSTISSTVLESSGIWMVAAPQDERGRVCLYKQIVSKDNEQSSTTTTPTPDEDTNDGDASDSDDDTVSGNDDSADDDEDDSDTSEGNGIFGDANEEALLLEEQDASQEPSCFPASAVVSIEDGSMKTLSELQIGDRVMVAPGLFSEIFMFTHKLDDGMHDFVRIVTDSGKKLSVSAGHFIYVGARLMPAGKATIGDFLELADGTKTEIISLTATKEHGLYNPQTAHGDIIVNDIRTSTYTSAVEPPTAHALLTPLRALYNYFSFNTAYFDGGADGLASMISARPAALLQS